MAVTLLNPAGLATPPDLYKHMSIATGSKMVFLAGQVAVDAEGRLVGEGDLAAQIEQCYANIGAALAEIGSSFDDVVKMTLYVVDWSPDKWSQLESGINRGFAKAGAGPAARPPGSMIGVATLDVPEHLVEVEAIAVID